MIILVTGGAASGKSELAERIACWLAKGKSMLYIAAMNPDGEEAQKRIARHRALRAGKGFTTLEHYKNFNILQVPEGFSTVLFECMSNALANEMFLPDGAGNNYKDSILQGMNILEKACKFVVIVTNDVFLDGAAYDTWTMQYLYALGELNQALAQRSDIVVESVCGIPVILKGER